MDFDFLDTELVSSSRRAILSFKTVIEESKPSNEEINQLCGQIHSYPHTTKLDNDFSIAAVDGSGEFPALQQDDIFMHFVTAAGLTYQTYSHRQNKLVLQKEGPSIIKQFILLNDDDDYLKLSYKTFFEDLLGKDLSYCVKESDYCETFSRFGKRIRHHQINWDNLSLSKASQIATHAYLIRSITELAMAIKLLIQEPRYLLLDTSLVYFLLGESPYLPEILKRHLITQANAQNVGVIALCKSHNIPNGNLINRFAKDQLNLKDHWYLRLPSEELGENTPLFLQKATRK